MGVFYAQQSRIITSNDAELNILFSFDSLSLTTKKINEKEYIVFEGASPSIFEAGSPALPFYSKSILIPKTGNTSLTVKFDEFIEYTNIEILPSLGLQKRKNQNDTLVFGESYQKNEFFPNQLAKLSTPFIIRELRGQTIQLFPYQYNPVTKTLRFYKNLNVEINFDSTQGINEITSASSASLGEKLFKENFINAPTHQEKYIEKAETGEMLVICPESYKETITPLVNWKNQKGIKTNIAYLENIGPNALSIKQYIQDYYSKNPNLLYLLLVGDAENVPAYSYGNFDGDEYWSDSYYGMLTGNDFYSELFVGRFSGTSDDVKTMVDRTLEYETNPAQGDWMTRAIGIGSAQGLGIGDDNQADWQHERSMRTSLLDNGYTYVYEFYDGSQGGSDSIGNPSTSSVINAISSGVGLLNYTGHGDVNLFETSNFTSSDVAKTTNFGNYPYIISVACNNGKFVSNTCLSETFLRSKKDNKITGAIGMCGSSILMDWAAPMKTQSEMVRLLGNSDPSIRKNTLGGIFNNGQFAMLEKYDSSAIDVIQTWVFFGDPSTLFRNQKTLPLNYSLTNSNSKILLTSNTDSIQIGISANNQLLEYGFFTNNKYSYTLPSDTTQEILITLTKQNFGIQQFIIGNQSNIQNIAVYPNPTNSELTIKSPYQSTVELLSLDGKHIADFTCNIGENKLQTNTIESGYYFLKFTSNTSSTIVKFEVIHP